MKKLVDILEDYTLKSIENDFRKNLKLVEDFGHLIADNSFPVDIQLTDVDYDLKYRGNFNAVFHLNIKRVFSILIRIKENSERESLFKRELTLNGKYRLKNIGDGKVEILSSSPYSKFGNTTRNYSKPEKNGTHTENEFIDFSVEDFLLS